MAEKQVTIVAQASLYRGGGSHPFRAGSAIALPESHAADLLKSGHVLTPEAHGAAQELAAAEASKDKEAPAAEAAQA